MSAADVIQQMRNHKEIKDIIQSKKGLFDSALGGARGGDFTPFEDQAAVARATVGGKITDTDPALNMTPELMAETWLTDEVQKAYVVRSEPVVIGTRWEDVCGRFRVAQGFGNAVLITRELQEPITDFRKRAVKFCNSKSEAEGVPGSFRNWMKNQHILVRTLVVSVGFTLIAQLLWWTVDVLFPYFECQKMNSSAMCWLFNAIRMYTVEYNNQLRWFVAAQVLSSISAAAIWLLSFL